MNLIKLQIQLSFHLEGNDVNSKFNIKFLYLKVPTILNFEMQLDYPNHTAKKNEIVTNTGNINCT